MDVPFSVNEWLPSEPREFSESLPDPERVAKFIDRLTVTTNFILRHPYDPNSWLGRARALTVLRYPELAAGDAHKAILLCRSILLGIDRKTARFRLGSRMGFWMRDEVDSMSFTDLDDWKVEREYYGEKFTDLQEHARDVLDRNLFFTPAYDEGRYTPQPYPWLEEKHRTRSDELVAAMNEELADPAKRNGLPSCCVLKRRAFGDGVGNGDGEDVLGVFATQDILEGEVVLVDKTSTWVSGFFPLVIISNSRTIKTGNAEHLGISSRVVTVLAAMENLYAAKLVATTRYTRTHLQIPLPMTCAGYATARGRKPRM